ncbi:contractile injection system tape measure protein [Aquimarina aggregata]|uniref:contractile injection system tape measure protein n=1 Tax=Aquimarina aggregata TaxID=1642818 RepID=UPI0024900EAC|nr:contractile injection system tape measure protein [Aquimarina aggregata]
MGQKHLIGKQVLKVDIDATEDAYAVQQKISDWVQKELNPAIENLFDRLVDEHIIARFDSIEIDIGNINLDGSTMNGVIEKIIRQLRENIEDRLHNIGNQGVNKEQGLRKFDQEFFNKNGKSFQSTPPVNGKNIDPKENNTKDLHGHLKNNDSSKEYNVHQSSMSIDQKESSQSQRKHYFDIWLYWLEKGILPSYTIAPQETWITKVLEHLGMALDGVTILEHKLKKYPIALHRLVLQHTPKDLKSIVELYTGFSQDKVLQMIKEIEIVCQEGNVLTSKIIFRSLEIRIWKKIFEYVILKREKLDSISIGRQVLQHLFDSNIFRETKLQEVVDHGTIDQKEKEKYQILLEILDKNNTTRKEKNIRPTSSTEKEESESEDKKEFLPSENNTNNVSKDKIQSNETTENHGDKIDVETTRKNENKSTKEGTGFTDDEEVFREEALPSPQYFNTAGVVLLNPFINNFFTRLGLIGGKDFKDFESRSKAVVLLHFLATGKENPVEYEMVLPKFLCEMPSNMPLDHTIKITEEEKEEAVGLLKIVIEHWGALGNISADGLREGFLMRQGKLENESTGWKLYIEQKAMDILLDRLPWNISIVKLPWMKEILTVEWR